MNVLVPRNVLVCLIGRGWLGCFDFVWVLVYVCLLACLTFVGLVLFVGDLLFGV